MALSPEKLFALSSPPETSTLISDSDADPARCSHLTALFAHDAERAHLLAKFKGAVGWRAQRAHEAVHTPPAKRRKVSSPVCGTCGETMARPFVCLHCSYAGCWQDEHVSQHLKDEGHVFCVDVKLGAVFCVECDDFIHDATLDALFRSTILSIEERVTKFQVGRRTREAFQPWEPTLKDKQALEDTIALPCQGRRGLLNLGQTCFLNVILQSLVHNPLLRNYFLSDKHNSKTCKTKDCTSCEVDKLFAEIYTPTSAPYGPTTLLATTWRTSSPLSGYAQHDAHEALIALLNALHASARGSTNVSCNCIVHGTFAGQLMSEVRCSGCGSVSGTVDPCLDFCLEVRAAGALSLAECLRRFTQPEKLTPADYSCPKCGKGAHDASKRLSIRKLPPVLSFQFKRFNQGSAATAGPATKITTPVRVPASINMAPYTTAALAAKDSKEPFAYPGPEALYEYDLFAVINHEGQIDNGHYTNFARAGDEWYRFDDEKVAPTTLQAVLAAPVPVYMAFYVKRRLDYKAVAVPTYVLSYQEVAEREEREKKGGKGRDTKEREAREREAREREAREREEREREEREREEREREEREREREVEDELLALS